MVRVNVFVEGQTEETFVREVLTPYFAAQGIYLNPILAKTSPLSKGGIVSYGKVKHQITLLCKKDPTAFVTTLIDYYGLPTDFPKPTTIDANAHVKALEIEQALKADIAQANFIPNLLVHEFEALLFSAPHKFTDWFEDKVPTAKLEAVRAAFETPEHINNNPNTAPSKRILSLIPKYRKTLHGPIIAADIGLDVMRRECVHFNNWVEGLLRLAG